MQGGKDLEFRCHPRMLCVKSSMDSKEVVQNLTSPLMGLLSHSLRVFSMAVAWEESEEKEKSLRRFGSWLDEKGTESASSLATAWENLLDLS